MTENKYSWLENIMQEMLTERLNTPQHKPMYFGDYKAKILTHIEAEKAEARIDEWKEFQWAHDVSDTIKDIVYVNYIKDRVSGLKMELGELTKELKEEA